MEIKGILKYREVVDWDINKKYSYAIMISILTLIMAKKNSKDEIQNNLSGTKRQK